VFGKLEEYVEEAKAEKFVLAEGFERGIMFIRRICAFGLLNTELLKGLTKQDPFVIVKMGEWTDKTKINYNEGTDSVWDSLDMNLSVDKTICEEGKFEVVVKTKKTVGETVVGVGEVSLRRAVAKLNSVAELSLDLKNAKGQSAGRVVLYVELQKEVKESDWVIDSNFKFGILKVIDISAFSLKNTELLGKQDPYVVLSIGDWTDKTYTINEAGDDASWKFLPIQCDMNRQLLESSALDVKVWDENSGRADALIGVGSASLISCGAQIDKIVELRVKLVDEKGQPAGRLVINCSLCSIEKEAELPVTFENGLIHVKRISVVFDKQRNWFGSSGSGGGVLRLSCGDFSANATVESNVSDNFTLNYLDYKIPVDVKVIKVGLLGVEIISKQLLQDKQLGIASIELKRAGSKLNSDVELIGELRTSANVACGKIVVQVNLSPVAALSRPVLDLPQGFSVGIVTISAIKAFGLKNNEVLGKQVTYVISYMRILT
jgi:hypothetical protein